MKRIFVLHHDTAVLYAYEDMLKSLGYEVFATNNYYKFLLYTAEIPTDFLIFDAEDRYDEDFVKALKNKEKTRNIPLLLIVNRGINPKIIPEITHILFKPFQMSDFFDILQKYQQNLTKNALFHVENKQNFQDLHDIMR